MKVHFFITLFIFIAFTFFASCDNGTEPPISDKDSSHVVVRKPNLYLYPTKKTEVDVKILFPLGGKLLTAIPNAQNNIWSITVDTNGIINNSYRYIFYEYKVPDHHQKQKGWIVKRGELLQFFKDNMEKSGFNETEITDFIDYWIPKLTENNYYQIYPQYKKGLDKMSIIKFSVRPDNFYRLQYFIRGVNKPTTFIEKPKMESAKREGFYVLEWGVILN